MVFIFVPRNGHASGISSFHKKDFSNRREGKDTYMNCYNKTEEEDESIGETIITIIVILSLIF
jgi:hypothetical protein